MNTELDVRVVPRSSKDKVVLQSDGTLKIWVHASPTDGQANDAVCALLAKALDVPKSKVSILRGHSSRIKRIGILDLEPSEAIKRLS